MIDWERRRFAIEYALGQGKTPAEIAARYQVGFPAMRKILAKWGLLSEVEPPSAPTTTSDKAQVAEPIPEPPTILPADGEPAMQQNNDDRNAAILKRVEAGIAYSIIAREFGVSRSTVSGIVSRHGSNKTKLIVGTSKKDNIRLANSIRAKQQHRDGRGGGKPMTFGRVTSFEPKPPALPVADLEPVADAVDLFSRTGCSWPFGGANRGDPVTFCNAPRCRIVRKGVVGEVPQLTAWCEEHWAKRNASAYTKVVAD